MKCWQCGYDLRMHDGLKCPECGAVKSAPRPNEGENAVVLTWGIVASIALVYCSVILAAGGHGTYVPLVVCFAPVSLPGAGFAFFFGLPLYVAYGIAMVSCKKAIHRRWCILVIAVLHYGSVFAYWVLWPQIVANDVSHLRNTGHRESGVFSICVTIFLATNAAAIAWAFWPRRAERHAAE